VFEPAAPQELGRFAGLSHPGPRLGRHWLAELPTYGLVPENFVPDQQNPGDANLLRARKHLACERSRHIQRLQKGPEDANIKLDSVITHITGLSDRRMIEALIVGETDPDALVGVGSPADQSQPSRTGGRVARSGERPSSVHAAPYSPAYRRDRRRHHSDRSGG
jgi:hypothetical protein